MTSPVWHPFTQHGLNEPAPLVTHAEGAILHTADGRRVIDAISSWWVTTHGHCHPRIMAAIRAQSEKLDQLIFAGWTHEPAETLARDLVAMMPPALTKVFFSDSGSTSVEVALKMALGHFANRGEDRSRIIVMEGSYHGDTVGGMSVGARGVFNKSYAPLLFDVDVIPFPERGKEALTMAALEEYCAQSPPPAALIVEPMILGAGGMRIYLLGVLRAMREICAAHGVLFIADEVMTGWGRTGALLACEWAQIVPDLLCLSKGLTGGSLPLAVTLATEEIFASHLSEDRSRMFFHSSSYTANPIACAAAIANLAIWRDEPVLERIERLVLRQTDLSAPLHGKVSNLRQIGTIIAMEFEQAEGSYMSTLGPQLAAFFRERDVLLRPLGNTVYVMPPYCVSDDDLERVYEVIGEAVEHFSAR
ncbi:adenosylmethionine--8-amino-7-oxononanoate transaminase [Sphingomonas sp. J315]|uniref:adenosylmethionine--8-amino-7-oxononanoate transaminase n=1 Tax=Sphingomonas sp. J315 TaxID=2898433 RepID=UPI0021AE1B6B|nr:adenosylmethionine--8-amino-7-oxononanoate transaminase [Sphingomonas sp. J315]UUX98908.1 adenosylmethionine--8-amino-7-oxononanoate transaminase [Sphingomonas sp. J315]